VLLSEKEWPSFCGERASGVERIRNRHRDEITTCVSNVRKKATLGANQHLLYELIGNGLYSPLPIRQRSVTDLSSPLLIGL
jgi:hypothetical protein